MEDFKDFVKRENQNRELQFNPDDTKRKYIEYVNRFYQRVEQEWLFPFINNNEIKIIGLERPITEQLLGQYTITEKVIVIGNRNIYLRPVGAILSGSFGRIDIIYEARTEMFILVEPSIRTPKQMLDRMYSQQMACGFPNSEINLEWKYVSKYPQLNYETINSYVFQRILMEITHG